MSNSCVMMEESHPPHHQTNRRSWIEFNEQPIKSISSEIINQSPDSSVDFINQNDINVSIDSHSQDKINGPSTHLPPPPVSNRSSSRANSPIASDRLTPVDFSTGGHPLAIVRPNSSCLMEPVLNETKLASDQDKQAATLRPSRTEFASNNSITLPVVSPMSPSSAKMTSPEMTVESRIQMLTNVSLKEESLGISGTPSSRPLSTISADQQAFCNGNLLVKLLPLNRHCAWITPALFKPELVPEELMANGLRLTVEDYVAAMQSLVNDFRFNLYILFYKRLLIILTVLGFCFLMILLFSGAKGPSLFTGAFFWLLLNAFGFFFTLWLKFQMTRQLEQCVAQVNEQFMKANLLLGVDDQGHISCHKVALTFIYFDVTYCLKYLNDMIENEERARDPTVAINSTIQSLNTLNSNGINRPDYTQPPLSLIKSDLTVSDIIITGQTPTRFSQKQKYGEKLLLRYSQRYVKELCRNKLSLCSPLHVDATTEPPIVLQPRHCATARCPCQFIEEHLKFKPLNRPRLKDLFV